MITLIVHRYHSPVVFPHDSFEEAAEDAVSQMDLGQSYPEKIVDGEGNVLWEHDGPFGKKLRELREISEARKGGGA